MTIQLLVGSLEVNGYSPEIYSSMKGITDDISVTPMRRICSHEQFSTEEIKEM